MNSLIERGPYGAQFCIYGPDDCQEIGYQLELMLSARPESLLPVFRQVSARGPRYAYPITGLFSLSELAAGKQLHRRQAQAFLTQMKSTLHALPDHLLSAEQVLLNPDALFVKTPEMRLQLVYQPFLPVTDFFSEQQLVSWFGETLYRSRFMRRRWKKKFAASRPAPSGQPPAGPAESITRLQLASIGLATAQLAALAATASAMIFPERFTHAFSTIRIPLLAFFLLTIPIQIWLLLPNRKDLVQKAVDQLKRMNPVALFDRGRHAIVKKAEKSEAHLGRVREMPTELLSQKQATFRLATLSEGMIGTAAETAGQRAFILTEEFVIGRDFRTVDLCLSGYAVGRRHAQIIRQGATFFIKDLGSKNGTRLNGERLDKLVEYRLPDHCQLQFADRLFYFEAEELLGQEAVSKAS